MATTGCRISATIVDLITPKRNNLAEFFLTTVRRISATIVDLISAKRNIFTELCPRLNVEFLQPAWICFMRYVLTEFMLTTGRRISVTIVDLISAKRDILTEFMTTIGNRIFARHFDKTAF